MSMSAATRAWPRTGSTRKFTARRGRRARIGDPALRTPRRSRGRRYCTVVSFRRDGAPVATPVWFGAATTARCYFRSLAESYKIRRIRANPRVLVAPCTRRGRPTGSPLRRRRTNPRGRGGARRGTGDPGQLRSDQGGLRGRDTGRGSTLRRGQGVPSGAAGSRTLNIAPPPGASSEEPERTLRAAVASESDLFELPEVPSDGDKRAGHAGREALGCGDRQGGRELPRLGAPDPGAGGPLARSHQGGRGADQRRARPARRRGRRADRDGRRRHRLAASTTSSSPSTSSRPARAPRRT